MVALLRFWFRKVAWRSKFSEFFHLLEEVMVAAFMEMDAPTSRLSEAQQGVIIPNLLKTF